MPRIDPPTTLDAALARIADLETSLLLLTSEYERWQAEAAARQAECITLGKEKHELIEALSFCLTQCRASGHLSSEPHIQQAFAAIALARREVAAAEAQA